MSKENIYLNKNLPGSQSDLDRNYFDFEPSHNIRRVEESQAANLSQELLKVQRQLQDVKSDKSALENKVQD